MKTKSQRGFSLVWAIIAIAIMAVGASAVIVISRSNAEQQAQLAAQAQRATYTTFQQEVVINGIDPSRIVNPLGAVTTSTGEQSGGVQQTVGGFSVTTGTAVNQPGSASVGTIGVTGVSQTGERGGGLGLSISAGGNSMPSSGSALNPPVFVVSLPLNQGSFPASGWVVFPTNPPGTVYRYTTDGSSPISTSPVWNSSTASSVNAANFPSQVRMAAFNSNTAYTQSSTAALGPITMVLPAINFSRYAGGSSTVFTYADMTGGPPNGILLSNSSVSGVTLTLKYTVDGSSPTSGTTYGGNFIVPFVNWTGGSPATAVVRAALIGPDARYVTTTTSFALSNQATQLTAPGFSIADGSSVADGSILSFVSSLASINLRYMKDAIIDLSSPVGWSTLLP